MTEFNCQQLYSGTISRARWTGQSPSVPTHIRFLRRGRISHLPRPLHQKKMAPGPECTSVKRFPLVCRLLLIAYCNYKYMLAVDTEKLTSDYHALDAALAGGGGEAAVTEVVTTAAASATARCALHQQSPALPPPPNYVRSGGGCGPPPSSPSPPPSPPSPPPHPLPFLWRGGDDGGGDVCVGGDRR